LFFPIDLLCGVGIGEAHDLLGGGGCREQE